MKIPVYALALAAAGIIGPDVADAARPANPVYVNISRDTSVSNYNAPLGSQDRLTNVPAGITYEATNGPIHGLHGNWNISGLVRTRNQQGNLGMSSNLWRQLVGTGSWNAHMNVSSTGVVHINDIGSRLPSDLVWYPSTLYNDGLMQWCMSGAVLGWRGTFFPEYDWVNRGVQHWTQDRGPRHKRLVLANRVANKGQIVNDGTMIIDNLEGFQVASNIVGNGCWKITRNSGLEIRSTHHNNVPGQVPWTGQSIYMTRSPNGNRIVFARSSWKRSQNFAGRIYGFGSDNGLCFDNNPDVWRYLPATGILEVTVRRETLSLNIGRGYDNRAIRVVKRNGSHCIVSSQETPDIPDLPETCKAEAPECRFRGETGLLSSIARRFHSQSGVRNLSGIQVTH